VRAQATFCPQCGRTMKEVASAEAAQKVMPESIETPETGPDGKEVDNSSRPLVAAAPSSRVSEPSPAVTAATPPPSNTEAVSLPVQKTREQIASGKPPEASSGQGVRRKSQRVVGAARDVVEERLAPRVEKLRQASNVVWGEAQDDPNLRFILIAVFLFIVALVIILLGTYIR
jgi:uncharacterized membrane protein